MDNKQLKRKAEEDIAISIDDESQDETPVIVGEGTILLFIFDHRWFHGQTTSYLFKECVDAWLEKKAAKLFSLEVSKKLQIPDVEPTKKAYDPNTGQLITGTQTPQLNQASDSIKRKGVFRNAKK